MGFSLYAV